MMRESYSQQHMQFDEPAASHAVNRALENSRLAGIY
jgi:hypothetical protein